jgi:hypothetical protein
LCALRWLKQIKANGTTDEFNVYYNQLQLERRNACVLFIGVYGMYSFTVTVAGIRARGS